MRSSHKYISWHNTLFKWFSEVWPPDRQHQQHLVTLEVIRNYWAPIQTYWIKHWAPNHSFNKVPWWFWCVLKFTKVCFTALLTFHFCCSSLSCSPFRPGTLSYNSLWASHWRNEDKYRGKTVIRETISWTVYMSDHCAVHCSWSWII